MLRRILIIILSSTLILVPLGVLHLGALNEQQSFVVVLFSGLVFSIALSVFEERISHVVVGGAAFYAVFATFLGNKGSDK